MNNNIYTVLFLVILTYSNGTAYSKDYVLQRATIVFSNGTSTDTLRGDASISGNMSINGSNLAQSFTICLNNAQCSSISLNGVILSVGENNSTVVIRTDTGIVNELFLLSLNPIITMGNTSDFVEVDQWIPANTAFNTSNQEVEGNQHVTHIDVDDTVFFGGIIGSGLKSSDVE